MAWFFSTTIDERISPHTQCISDADFTNDVMPPWVAYVIGGVLFLLAFIVSIQIIFKNGEVFADLLERNWKDAKSKAYIAFWKSGSIELNNTVDDSTGDDSSIELNNTVNEGAEYNVDEENHQYWHREVNNTAIPVDAASTGEDSDDEVDAASTGEDADDEVDEASTGEDSNDEVDAASTREDANDDDIDEASRGEDANDYESYEQENDNTADDSSIVESNDSTEEGADSSIESNSSVDEGADSTDEIHEDFNWSGDSDNNSDDDEDEGTDPEVRGPPDEASDHSHSPDQIKESLSHNYSLRSRSNLDKKHD